MARPRSRFRNRAEAAFVGALGAAAQRLGPERADLLGRRVGHLAHALLGGRRALARKNLARAFPERGEAEIAALARDVFAHFGGIALELLATAEESPDALLARLTIRNAETARGAAESRRGVVFLTGHLGNWEVAALATSLLVGGITVVARPLDNPALDERLSAYRRKSGNSVLPKAEAAREILRILRRGDALGILVDQHVRTADAVAVPFFGRPAATTTSLARFVDRTEALVVPTTAIRTAPGRYVLTYGEPVDVRALASGERAPEPLTARFNLVLEGLVRESPGQWLWLHNRWRLD